MSQSYPKSSRLLDRSEFLSFDKEGSHKFISKSFVAFVKDRPVSGAASLKGRLGLSIRGKIAGAVARNRFKRLCREYFRKSSDRFHGKDLHLVARQRLFFWDGKKACGDWGQLKTDLEKLGRWVDHRRRSYTKTIGPEDGADYGNAKKNDLPKHQSVSIRA
jgi:ribonuclease P protein component